MTSQRDPRVDCYVTGNRKWASSEGFKPPIDFSQIRKWTRESAEGQCYIVACSDPRCCPEEYLGMTPSNKAGALRVAGGRVQNALSSLYVLTAVGTHGRTGTIMVIHHTDCGMCYLTDEDIRESLRSRLPEGCPEAKEIDLMSFGCINDPEQTVRIDVEFLKASPYFKGMQVFGFVQDIHTGLLKEIA
ncbi:hypothetical protein DH86_00000872 [Scytalidium sp. 3C]|nr:hypothetical protein DH86_00000872 [Scytalidium sp. 3C]